MKEKNNARVSVIKIGAIYTISNVLVKGMAFLTTPLFTRLLSKAQYGDFSNISSWANIISIVVTLQLYVSIVRAKYDYAEEIDRYLSSILVLGNIFTLIGWGIVESHSSFFQQFMDMDIVYIRIIFVYALFSPAMQILIYKNRIYSQYKGVVCLTWLTLVTSTLGSLVLVVLMDDRLLGRTIGNYLLIAGVDIGLWFYILVKGRCISPAYWKYALCFSVPLIPHELAGQLLLSSDRIIIKRLCGAEDAALYSLAYTISTIASVLLSSMNQAWQPWLYDKMKEEDEKTIFRYTTPYTLLFAVGCIGIMLIGPEIVLVFGGTSYLEAQYVIPPVCMGIMLQFLYTLYANIEFYEKKTGWISTATLIAAGLNIALNFVMIPLFGYIAAAYTTAIGFAAMFLLHYWGVRLKTKYGKLYDLTKLMLIAGAVMIATMMSLVLYQHAYIRYICIVLYLFTIVVIGWKYKERIIEILKRGGKNGVKKA